jgi:hypothetical protein
VVLLGVGELCGLELPEEFQRENDRLRPPAHLCKPDLSRKRCRRKRSMPPWAPT